MYLQLLLGNHHSNLIGAKHGFIVAGATYVMCFEHAWQIPSLSLSTTGLNSEFSF